jgi:hypothetical protein
MRAWIRTVCTQRCRVKYDRAVPAGPSRKRSALPRDEARRRYVEIGELAALRQIHADSERLDRRSIAVGPFARLDANAVAAEDGKTRGAITNLFGSQAAFRVATMELALNAEQQIEHAEYPAPADYASADEWVDAFFAAQSARGPRHGAEPVVEYASLWALWLSAVPYGLWSEQISGPSLDEYRHWVAQLEDVLAGALERFELTLRDDTTLTDLAAAIASLVEGAWLNQCLTTRHPSDASQPAEALLRRSGRLLWRGATTAR